MSGQKVDGPKIVIVGAGSVGTTFAYSLLIRGLVSQIAIIDVNRDRAEGEVMDLNHGMPFAQPVRIWAGDYSDCGDADIVVISVDKGQKIEQSRLELAQGNFELLKQIVPSVTEYNDGGILLVVTNPLDVMTYAALKLSRFPRNRVIGSGTILDTARLRYLLGERLQVDPRNVHAYIIGEHGDSEVPVWSLANVAGIRLKDYYPLANVPYDPVELDNLFLRVRNAGYEIIRRKGRTFYAVAMGMTKIVESIIRNENAVSTVSCLLEDYYGVSDVCLSVPVILNRTGIKEIIRLPLDEKEIADFQKSAATIKNVTDSLGI
ncbi:MAG TPA: L-lactate dehydrogenase [candidate division Zixibacteria bacterium]|nr:L-lactate dehydrogenase [candidate division Zixibacteria bacterium]